MLEHPFYRKIKANIAERSNAICVGLDPDISKLPHHLEKSVNGVEIFLKSIIEATHDTCIAYKANIAFFEALGIEGLRCLQKIRTAIPKNIPFILDAKRGDIGNTSTMQASYLFDQFDADASTLNPYMGLDSVEPFLEFKEKFHFILALTSNPGSSDFQKKLLDNNKPLYRHVAEQCVAWSSAYSNVGLVVGGTHQEMTEIRQLNREVLFLIPGVGAQGGNADDAYKRGKNSDGLAVINVGRALLYADQSENYAQTTKTLLKEYLF